ncbi:amidohydrolase [Egibacter rhizosphaerae]|uniref:Amidohydrolase n=1 Tax=Egibacter rhizosphaerae TaxID=1670831 RepID=A0A411YIK0_9ACTN|nr:amidohydrolase [Egibacter rhizosphaerae]QBI20902.1 amidohydrolase [Egibacter rhizosphaerae]
METAMPPLAERVGGRATRSAELVLTGGEVFVGLGLGRERAVAIADGRVLAVGSDEQCRSTAGPGTVVVDLQGRTVVPGLIDSHVHVVRAGLTWSWELRWDEVPSLREGLDVIARAARQRPRGEWLAVVGGWHPGQFVEHREPTLAELEEVAPDHPVYVQLLYERALLNRAAMRACGLDAGTPDPAGGRFLRDEQGAPTGVVTGVPAFNAVLSAVPAPDRAAAVASTRQLAEHLLAFGLTGVVDPGGFGMDADTYAPLFELWRGHALPLRTRLYVCPTAPGQEEADVDGWLRHQASGFGDPWLRLTGIGEIAAFGCHDMEGLAPHEVTPESAAVLERVGERIAARGWPLHLHAIRDETIDAVLDVWERIDAHTPLAGLRWSLAHADAISSRNLGRLEALGAGIGVQDRLVYRGGDSAAAWGAEVAATAPPLRRMRDAGIPVGAGTDATRVASPNPWVSLWWLVTGGTLDGSPPRDPGERLTREEALHCYTAGSAWFSFEEHERGTLRPGARADLAVLDDDYFTVPEARIRELRAELTVVDGRALHAEGAFAHLADPSA